MTTNARKCRLTLAAMMLCGLATLPAQAAERPSDLPTISSTGSATVDAAPDYAVFWFHAEASGDSVSAAVSALDGFEQKVRAELESRKIAASELTFTAVAVPDAKTAKATRSVRLRFATAPFASPDKGPGLFAALCDSLVAAAGALDCSVSGPEWALANPESLAQNAIQRAVENAYPNAEAAATVLGTQLTVVQSVAVQDLVWNKTPDYAGAEPTLRRIACTANVQVTYLFSLSAR